MANWSHSGLEGYCKAAASFLGYSSCAASWLSLCRDIFPDRTVSNLTKAWTFSNERQGRSCRQMVFEKAWLQGRHGNDYADDAETAQQLTSRPTSTASTGGHEQYHYVTTEECRQTAIRQCEVDAVEACINHLTHTNSYGDYDNDPQLALLVTHEDFAILFFANILPEIERGFQAERYHASDIRQYSLSINGLLANLQCMELDVEAFRSFARALVAGLVYGPNHPLAVNREWDLTLDYIPYDKPAPVSSHSIRVTQLFDQYASTVGYSEVYPPNRIIFFGRLPDRTAYMNRASLIFKEDADLLDILNSRETVVFPISSDHIQTGNLHGMLIFLGESWWFYDFSSTNGTSVVSRTETHEVRQLISVCPGDHIRLGAPSNASDAMAFWGASTILVSQYADERTI